jgi:hypothetical protein
VLDAVQATGHMERAWYDEPDFSIRYHRRGASGESGRIYLYNTFHETAGLELAERAARVRRLVDTVVSTTDQPESWDGVRPKLRPVLRSVSFGLGVPGATTVDSPRRLLARPAMPYLNELVVVDEPTSMAYVTRARLAEWDVTADEVFAAARDNLAGGAAAVTRDRSEDGRPQLIRFVDSGDGYFVSMLLVDGFLAGLADRVGGRPVAFIPDKDTLMIGPDQPGGLPQLYEMVEAQYREAPRRISPVAYTVDEHGRVVPYQAPAGTELELVVHRAEVLLASGEYAAQKEALEAAHEESGTDIFVASVLVAERPDQSLFSVAVWDRDVDALLPVADYLAFQPTDPQLVVPFDVAVREAYLVPEPDYQPVRYRVAAWPGSEVMDRLRAWVVDL